MFVYCSCVHNLHMLAHSHVVRVISARQYYSIMCYRPSVRLSVCHTGGSVKNG